MAQDHKTLSLYIKHGDTLGSVCTRLGDTTDIPVALVTVLRDPVQRLVSQLFFFSGPLAEFHLFGTGQHSVAASKHAQEVKQLWQRVLSNSRSITASQMRVLLRFLQHKERSEAFFPRLSLQSYEAVLSRQSAPPLHSTQATLQAASAALDRFAVVGTMEHMPALFVLLALEFGHPLTDSCFLHNRHENKKHRHAKPRLEEWQPGVVAAMREFVAHDEELWRRALLVHERQLERHNLTLSTAAARWQGACAGLDRAQAQAPQIWLDDKRRRPPPAAASSSSAASAARVGPAPPRKEKGSSSRISRISSIRPEKAGERAGSGVGSSSGADEDEDDASVAGKTARNIALCATVTASLFYCLSRL